jgi:hypothetical protein
LNQRTNQRSNQRSNPRAGRVVVTLPAAFGFGAVILPRSSDCPRVVTVEPAVVPDISNANSTTIDLGLHAPWRAAHGAVTNRNDVVEALKKKLSTVVQVRLDAVPGLKVSPSSLVLPGKVVISAPGASPGHYLLTITGDGALPTRRWVRVV